MSSTGPNGFPSQKKTKKQKTKDWAIQCVDYADTQSGLHSQGVRKSRREKYINYRLYDGHIDMTDLELTVNPYKTIGSFIPDSLPHYPIAAPKIDLLVGEELNRRFEYKVVVSNPDAISEKERAKAELWKKQLINLLIQNKDEEEAMTTLEKYDKYLKFEWQDIKEMTATNILRHYSEKQHFKNIFNACFKDACLSGDEIVQVEVISNEPYMRQLNTLNVSSVRSGGSEWIQDSDLIVVEDYWNPGRILDTFYEELKAKDVTTIETYGSGESAGNKHTGNIHSEPILHVNVDGGAINDLISMAETTSGYGNYFDTNGNVRVLRVYWRSFRKVLKVKYYDENGDTQYDFFPENYKVDEDRGEEAKTMWINEMWEGTMIADSIYIQLRPMPIQFNDINNPSRCHAGIIGLTHNTSQFKSVCIMDRMKQYQYLYDATKDRLNKAMAKHLGPLMELDLASIPENWQMDKWLHFAHANGLAVKDSFKEGNKGASTGKLAGGMNQSSGVLNLQMGDYIQNQISFLEYIKVDMASIVGISPQREGAVSNRETVGGVERAVNQSSHITEPLFAKHELFKAKALEAFLEVAKISLKTGNKKLQYILGDESIQYLEVDDSFADGVYDVLISFNDKYQQLENVMKELAQAGIQNDKMDFSTLMQIYMSNSLSETRRTIELKEDEKIQREAEAGKAQSEQVQAQIASQEEIAQDERDLQERNNIRDNNTRLILGNAKALKEGDVGDDGIAIDAELLKHRDEIALKFAELAQADKHHKVDNETKLKDIEVKKIIKKTAPKKA